MCLSHFFFYPKHYLEVVHEKRYVTLLVQRVMFQHWIMVVYIALFYSSVINCIHLMIFVYNLNDGSGVFCVMVLELVCNGFAKFYRELHLHEVLPGLID
jgi:hypothetical protein